MLDLTKEQCEHIFTVDFDTGNLYWNNPIGRKVKRGDLINSKHNGGYIAVRYKNKAYLVHRIIAIMAGFDITNMEIDHINHKRDDNRLSNLRVVERIDNRRNASRNKNNTSGQSGVNLNNTHNMWVARITIDYKEINLGTYKNKADAIQARKDAEIKYRFHVNHGVMI
jgi:hypothetical protein